MSGLILLTTTPKHRKLTTFLGCFHIYWKKKKKREKTHYHSLCAYYMLHILKTFYVLLISSIIGFFKNMNHIYQTKG